MANYEPENGYYLVMNKNIIDSITGNNGKMLEEVVFRKPFTGIKVSAEKIQLAKENPIPEYRPNQRAMFDRGDIILLNREFRESANIAPGIRLKMFLKFKSKGGKRT